MDNNININNYGEVVACDFCNEGEETMGGTLIGSYAICGDCSEKYNYYDKDYKHADEIDEFFDNQKTFRDNVLDYRERVSGTRDAIQIMVGF